MSWQQISETPPPDSGTALYWINLINYLIDRGQKDSSLMHKLAASICKHALVISKPSKLMCFNSSVDMNSKSWRKWFSCRISFLNIKHFITKWFYKIWISASTVLSCARPCEILSHAICEQQRRRSACASAQSDQRLCFRSLDSKISLVSRSEISRF